MLYKFYAVGVLLLSTLIGLNLSAQTSDERYTASQKGKFFFSWGGNRAKYSRSDIRFTGEDYDFTLEDVRARDKPKGYHIDYINPTRLTIPQTNAKIGYFFSDKYYVAVGLDHMKYVMIRDQVVSIEGHISLEPEEPGSMFNGEYDNEAIQLTEDFLEFEHTDGLNLLYAEIGRFDNISHFLGITNSDKVAVNLTEGIALGFMLPRSNTTLLQKERYDEFHVAGYGVALHMGLNITFFKHFFAQGGIRGGWIDLPDIRTTQNPIDRAAQNFFFLESSLTVGGIFRI